MSQLPADCLNETFEYLKDDAVTLRSCLLVNRLWCVVSVRILWRSIRNYGTLISCLPNESKEILLNNGITSAFSDSPMFNYSSFCKVLSIFKADSKILMLLKNKNFDSSQNLINIVIREICKLLMNQISSLKVLDLELLWLNNEINIPNFTIFPGAKGCLKNLSELHCGSYTYPEIFYQLSKICHNIQLLHIYFGEIISNGLTDLISAQQNLKHLSVTKSQNCEDDFTSLLTTLPNTLIKLSLFGEECHVPLSFITKFTNLQEISLSFKYRDYIDDLKGFEELNYVTFSQLQILKLQDVAPREELLIKFFEINGKNLREIYMGYAGKSLNLAIAKFCPNLRKLLTEFYKDDSEILKVIFNSCKYLESIIIWFGYFYLSEKDLFKVVATHSPENFYELKLYYSYGTKSKLLPEEFESFFISWVNRVPLSLIHCNDSNTFDQNSMKIIEKYIKLGTIKKFQVLSIFDNDEFK